MSWYSYYGYPYAYGLPMQNHEEVPAQAWQYVPANPEDITAATIEPPGLLYVSLSPVSVDGSYS